MEKKALVLHPSSGNRERGACKAHLKHDSSERVGGVSWRPARAQRRSDPSSRVLAADGGRHLGSLGKRHPSRGGAGRCALSGLLVVSLLLQVASRQSCQRPGCPETAKEGNLRRPSPCDGNRAALDSFGATFQVTGPSLGPPTFAPFAGHRPGRSGGIARVKPSAVHVGESRRLGPVGKTWAGPQARRRVACMQDASLPCLNRKGGPLCREKRVAALVSWGFVSSTG